MKVPMVATLFLALPLGMGCPTDLRRATAFSSPISSDHGRAGTRVKWNNLVFRQLYLGSAPRQEMKSCFGKELLRSPICRTAVPASTLSPEPVRRPDLTDFRGQGEMLRII